MQNQEPLSSVPNSHNVDVANMEATVRDSIDWSRFDTQVTVQAPVDLVFKTWITPSLIGKWFVSTAVGIDFDGAQKSQSDCLEAGDRFLWSFNNEDFQNGSVLELIPDSKLQLSLLTHRHDSRILITIYFVSQGDMTEVHLKQENQTPHLESKIHWYVEGRSAWSFFLANLKAHLEHGVDLRSHKTITTS